MDKLSIFPLKVNSKAAEVLQQLAWKVVCHFKKSLLASFTSTEKLFFSIFSVSSILADIVTKMLKMAKC